jgi:hypothetical protein
VIAWDQVGSFLRGMRAFVDFDRFRQHHPSDIVLVLYLCVCRDHCVDHAMSVAVCFKVVFAVM